MAIERMPFGSLFFNAMYNFQRLERDFCKTAGVYYGQPRILTVLAQNEGKTLSELSPIMGIGLPSLSVSLRNLQKSGLVVKSGAGKRQRIYLTDSGREKAAIFHQELDAFYTQCFVDLGEERIDRLFEDMEAFVASMEHYAVRYEGVEETDE